MKLRALLNMLWYEYNSYLGDEIAFSIFLDGEEILHSDCNNPNNLKNLKKYSTEQLRLYSYYNVQSLEINYDYYDCEEDDYKKVCFIINISKE